jgi:polar amino acid transport system substrate-binding protein
MKLGLIALAGAVVLTSTSMGSSQAVSSAPSVFTSAQAQAGAKVYVAQCSKCHGANLEGVSAPALRGAGSGLAGNSVGEAFTFISTQMPAGNPGGLSSSDYANVLAYILSRNGHAAGHTTLTPALAKKSKYKV